MNCAINFVKISLVVFTIGILFTFTNGAEEEETLRSPLAAPPGGWSTPAPSGWAEPVAPSSIILVGAAEVSGSASATNSHSGAISASAGGGWVREGRRKVVEADPVARFYFERDP